MDTKGKSRMIGARLVRVFCKIKINLYCDRKEEGTWDDRRRDGGINCTLRIKEQEKRLTLNEHDDDDDDDLYCALSRLLHDQLCRNNLESAPASRLMVRRNTMIYCERKE